MKSVEYLLRPKSLASTRPPAPHPEYRLLRFTIRVERRGKRLGGNNIQAVVGAPSEAPRRRHGREEEVALWLPSQWWVSLRNQFAAAPATALVREDDVAEVVPSGTDVGRHVDAIARWTQAGFDRIAIVALGDTDRFFAFWEQDLHPALEASKP
jgi:hypothetical protein